MEFGEELQRRKFLQLVGGLCDQLLETTEDAIWQGAEGSVGNVPAQRNRNILIAQSMLILTDVLSCYM